MEVEEEVRRIVEQVKELHDSATSFVSSSSHEELSLRQRSSLVDASITRLHSTLLSDKHHHDPKLLDKIEEDLQRARCMLADGDSSSFLPSKPQGFLYRFQSQIQVLILTHHCVIESRTLCEDVLRTSQCLSLKDLEEYNSYRDRTALLFLVQLYQAWLLFLYACLAMRENILRANGSDIRSCDVTNGETKSVTISSNVAAPPLSVPSSRPQLTKVKPKRQENTRMISASGPPMAEVLWGLHGPSKQNVTKAPVKAESDAAKDPQHSAFPMDTRQQSTAATASSSLGPRPQTSMATDVKS